uniref:cytochrome c oxidase subunit III n=1 Tax=Busonia albilateralis TaxID=2479888 RepID=UPI00241158E0|nr:cytochrome c oxidase subunit III [Busonia albilateralis]WEP24815.1 cytochrome c oxidase subunit III [Busonia albilateralis]
MNNHPFHIVEKSPWPLLSSMGVMTMLLGTIYWLNYNSWIIMSMGLFIIVLVMIQWWRDIIRESTFQGNHTFKVKLSMKIGMIMFIASEIMLFISLFWAFFHSSLAPSIEIGSIWPPSNMKMFNPLNIPLLNTIILLSSGISLTWSHQSLLKNKMNQSINSMILTIMLGIYFTFLQGFEYYESSFCISDSIYGSLFFLTTGFHGLHVIVGTTFIVVSLIRMMNLHFSSEHHVGYEASAWYWHFVDVVWLFLYISIYWWGS